MRCRKCLSDLIASCLDAKSLAQLHALLLRSGHLAAADCFFATRLASAYSKLRHTQHARKLFDEIAHPSTFLYNAILRAHSGAGQWPETLYLFRCMIGARSSYNRPDEFTLSVALKACAALSALQHGQAVHGLAVKTRGACSDMFVGSALVEMYSRCGEMEDAMAVFDGFSEPDVVLRTSVVTAYQRNGNFGEAVSFFSRMVMGKGVVPDPVTLISVVSAIAQLGNLYYGKSCHGFFVRMGFEYKLPLANSILNLYAKLGEINSAMKLFDRMHVRDVITWSSMISCYAHNGHAVAALDVYKKMIEIGVEPNFITLVSVLQACALALDLEEGRKVHEFATKKGYGSELAVSTALIDMYMNCSCYAEAIDIFHRMPEKDVVAWAAIISGYAQNGMANESLKVFQDMLSDGPNPDAVVMVKVLTASSQLGILRQALCIHGFLVKDGFDKKVFVGAALVDLYSKCGSLSNAIEVFKMTDEKDVVLWSSMIAAYGMHGLGIKAIATFEHMIQSSIRPNSVTFVTILSACSHSGLVNEGRRIFDGMSQIYGVIPTSEHYCIMVDLFGRTGKLQEALRLIQHIPKPVSPHVWCALLSGCMIHHNCDMGELVARNLLKIEAEHAGYYNLLSNIYAFDEKWDQMSGVKRMMKERGIRKTPGYSSVEVNNEVYTFLAGERLQQGWEIIWGLLRELTMIMREESYCSVPLREEDLVEV
ncbi:pentatricopeptide repeat-containing protein [Canna indica]|uniref:Pentatricopeptide repeat-containing protein n=1 Tax=Canna indica TaxID=4628 RepID=A0AAQ3QQ99_9LILI|nr:pentatricopeptide repeat-containing protein [Canna indica]